LVPSIENGYFSRLVTLCIRESHPFDKQYVLSKATQSGIPRMAGQQLLQVYEQLMQNGEQEWSLTDAQKERLGAHLETEYKTLIGLLGDNFHSAVVRMAVQIIRIAMILSALRSNEEELQISNYGLKIYCTDEDYEAAEMIGNKMLLHMAAAYRMIDGDAQEVVPEIKPLDQRKVLFEQLKPEYKLQELITEAKSQGISRATVIRWNDAWQEQGMVSKIEYGHYRKAC